MNYRRALPSYHNSSKHRWFSCVSCSRLQTNSVTFTGHDNLTDTRAMSQDVNIAGVYANIYDVKLTAELPNPSFAVYLDNKENGPVDISIS